jgi:hypothetical protein
VHTHQYSLIISLGQYVLLIPLQNICQSSETSGIVGIVVEQGRCTMVEMLGLVNESIRFLYELR